MMQSKQRTAGEEIEYLHVLLDGEREQKLLLAQAWREALELVQTLLQKRATGE